MARLDATTRERGRTGLAAARLALRNARREAAAAHTAAATPEPARRSAA